MSFICDCVQEEGKASTGQRSVRRQWTINKAAPLLRHPLPYPITATTAATRKPPQVSPPARLGIHLELTDGHDSVENIRCYLTFSNKTKKLNVWLKYSIFVSYDKSSFLAYYKKKEWQESLSFEHIMCFAEPVLGGTQGHGKDLPQGRETGILVCPHPALLFGDCLTDGDSERRLWEGGGSFTLELVSEDTVSLTRGHDKPCWQWCLSPLYSWISYTRSYF